MAFALAPSVMAHAPASGAETQAMYGAVRWASEVFCADCPAFWADRLTVIADGRPTTITLTLPGLTGEQTWTPTIPGSLVLRAA